MNKTRILVVEDEGVVALDIQNRLTKLGYAVPAIAARGEEAVRKAEELRPDLVLMDIKLGGEMDGVTAAEQIRVRFDVPVVYLSAYADEETFQHAKITQPFGYVLKPLKERELHNAIEIALYKHQVDKQLKESEARYRAVSELVSDMAYSFRVEPDGSLVSEWTAGASLQVAGLTPEELDARGGWTSLVHPDDLPAANQMLQTNLTGQSGSLELRIITEDNEVHWVRNYCRPVWDEAQGRVVRMIGAAQDITEQMRAEEELRESQQLLRRTFSSLRDAVFIIDADTVKIQDCNPAASTMFGYSRQELLGQTPAFLHVDAATQAEFRERLHRALEEQGFLSLPQFRMKRKDGTILFTEHSVMPLEDEDGRCIYWVSVVRDITERIQAQEEIRRRTEGLAALNAVSAAAVSSLELDTVLQQIVQRTCQALDAAEGSILLRDADTGELFFAVSLTKNISSLRHHRLAPGQGVAGWVVQHNEPVRVDDVRCDPRWYPGVDMAIGFQTYSLLGAPLTQRGEVAGVIEIVNKRKGNFSDEDLSLLIAMASIAAAALDNASLYATSQARIKELALLNEIGLAVSSTLDPEGVIYAALSLSRRLFAADGIFLLQPDPRTGELAFAWALTESEPMQLSWRFSPGEGVAGWVMAQRRAVLVKDAQEDPRFCQRLDQYLGSRTRALMAAPLLTPERVVGVLEVVSWQAAVFTTDNLRTLQSIASTLAVALENARLYVEQKQLLQEREQAQARLIHSEKMSALGRLAASIAHEINNPLQAIQGCLTLAEEELAGRQRPEKLTRYLGIVSSEFERTAGIVRRMREFYRPMREGRLPTDVHFVLLSVLELANKQLQHSNIAVERQWATDLPLIQANPDHLKQVFLNLVLNAIDAMPQGGMLRISTAMDQIHADDSHAGSAIAGSPLHAVRIEFNDTGVGMSPEVRARLFEPFFTSKEHGSGLGLSISYGIIESHNGQIRVESQEGVGTTFTILLPVGSAPPAER